LATDAGNGLAVEAKTGLKKVGMLGATVRQAAGDWGVTADGASQWLPLPAPVALLAACLVVRAPGRMYGKETAEFTFLAPDARYFAHSSTHRPERWLLWVIAAKQLRLLGPLLRHGPFLPPRRPSTAASKTAGWQPFRCASARPVMAPMSTWQRATRCQRGQPRRG
jgi:hypothetical protein